MIVPIPTKTIIFTVGKINSIYPSENQESRKNAAALSISTAFPFCIFLLITTERIYYHRINKESNPDLKSSASCFHVE